MNARIKKLKDNNGSFVVPITHPDAVVDSTGKTLSQRLSEIGTGGSTVPEGEIDPRDIGYVEVVSETTSNLFDKRTVEPNGYYDQPTGSWTKDATYVASSLIPVTSMQQYTSKYSVIVTYWKSDKTYLGYTRNKTFTTPANTSFVRIAILAINLNDEMFVKGATLPSVYTPYGETPVYKIPAKTFIVEPTYQSIEEKHLVPNVIENKIIEDDRLEKARGKVNLFIETAYDGYNQPIHPKVITFASAWNGYKYWMATTPYPYALDNTENPHIHASNDLINWEVPVGVPVPLDDLTDGAVTYWSDTHLVYRSDLNRIECWYRGYRQGTNDIIIARKTTTNGIAWSAREVLYTYPGGGFLSHAVMWETDKYKAWVFGTGGGYYEISADGLTWTKIANLSYDTTGITFPIWHADVEKTDIGYEMVVQPVTNDCPTIDHYTSIDGIKWSNKKSLMRKNDIGGLDAGGFYRACLLKLNGIYYVFTSTISKEGERGITLSIATKSNNILSLKGIDASYLLQMNVPTKKPKGGKKGQIVFDQTLNKAIICTTGGRYAVWKDFSGNVV